MSSTVPDHCKSFAVAQVFTSWAKDLISGEDLYDLAVAADQASKQEANATLSQLFSVYRVKVSVYFRPLDLDSLVQFMGDLAENMSKLKEVDYV